MRYSVLSSRRHCTKTQQEIKRTKATAVFRLVKLYSNISRLRCATVCFCRLHCVLCVSVCACASRTYCSNCSYYFIYKFARGGGMRMHEPCACCSSRRRCNRIHRRKIEIYCAKDTPQQCAATMHSPYYSRTHFPRMRAGAKRKPHRGNVGPEHERKINK